MENFLKNLTPEDKKRVGYIEGREDLFETKVLSFESSSSVEVDQSELLVIARDPGGANALVPVLEILNKDPKIKIKAVVDGRAQETFQKKFKTTDITPKDGALAIDTIVGSPDLVVIDVSLNEQGIETYATSTFSEVPTVILEDYYGSALLYLRTLRKRNMRFPEKICVLDDCAKKILVDEFPELVEKIEITGQPAFDRFATEDTEAISNKTRQQLGINENDRVITFMSSLEGVNFVREFTNSLAGTDRNFKLIFRRHPRDNTTYEEYEKIFNEAGITLINTNFLDTDSVGAASDLIITSTSTESLHAIYRRKPNLNIVDKELDIYLPRTMPPTVDLGVSAGIQKSAQLSELLPQLLDQQSGLNRKLKENMERYYPKDGKNAERVASVVRQVLESK